MNELLAGALANRLRGPQLNGLFDTVAGLVRTLETDAFSGAGKKKIKTLPYPVSENSADPADWKLLLPDPLKRAIVFFEDNGSTQRMIGGLSQHKSKLTMVCWYNGALLNGIARERLTPVLLSAMTINGRNVPTAEPSIASLSLTGWTTPVTDPFSKYSAYETLFNFKNPPYGYLCMELSLTAYVSQTCIINQSQIA